MPVQEPQVAPGVGFPWEQLADAHEQLADAERNGTPADVDEAREYLGQCREQCGLVGTLLVLQALDLGTLELQKRLGAVFGELGVAAYHEAKRANARADAALRSCDALRQRINDLERRIDDLTPGVGEPNRTRRAI